MFFCSHEIQSSSSFLFILACKKSRYVGTKNWFKILLENVCNGNWKKVFRMSFREVVVLLAPRIIENDTSFRKAIPVEKRVGLWRLETGNSYRCIAKMFVIGKSTAVKISKDFCSALRKSCTYIKFPDSAVVT